MDPQKVRLVSWTTSDLLHLLSFSPPAAVLLAVEVHLEHVSGRPRNLIFSLGTGKTLPQDFHPGSRRPQVRRQQQLLRPVRALPPRRGETPEDGASEGDRARSLPLLHGQLDTGGRRERRHDDHVRRDERSEAPQEADDEDATRRAEEVAEELLQEVLQGFNQESV